MLLRFDIERIPFYVAGSAIDGMELRHTRGRVLFSLCRRYVMKAHLTETKEAWGGEGGAREVVSRQTSKGEEPEAPELSATGHGIIETLVA